MEKPYRRFMLPGTNKQARSENKTQALRTLHRRIHATTIFPGATNHQHPLPGCSGTPRPAQNPSPQRPRPRHRVGCRQVGQSDIHAAQPPLKYQTANPSPELPPVVGLGVLADPDTVTTPPLPPSARHARLQATQPRRWARVDPRDPMPQDTPPSSPPSQGQLSPGLQAAPSFLPDQSLESGVSAFVLTTIQKKNRPSSKGQAALSRGEMS